MGNHCMGILGCPGVGSKKGGTLVKERCCTDLPMLFAFLAIWGLMLYIMITATQNGADPKRLTNGFDYKGVTCTDSDVIAYPVIADIHFAVCTNNCDFTSNADAIPEPYESTSVLGHCAPVDEQTFGSVNTTVDDAQQYLSDLETSMWIIVASAGIALALSMLFTWLSQFAIKTMVVACIIGTIATGFAIGALLLEQAYVADKSPIEDGTNTTLLYVFGSITIFLTLLFSLFVCALRRKILMAIEVVREASKAIIDMPTLLSFPLYPFVFICGFFVFWIYTSFVLWTDGTFATADAPEIIVNHVAETGYDGYKFDEYVHFTHNQDVNSFLALHFFFLLWVVQFIVYLSYMILAGVFIAWYFTREHMDGSKSVSGCSEMCASSGRTIVFHMGTVAFGSLVIAIINFVRAIVSYIQRKTQDKGNAAQKVLFCCCQCCMYCVKCCLDKISKNAFIFTALYGDPFLVAAWGSFTVLFRNITRVAAINLVGEYIIILGKLLIAATTTGICTVILIECEPYKSDLYSVVLPLIIIALISYAIGSSFMALFEVAIDVIFLSFLVDEEENNDGNMYASKSLQDIIDQYSEESAKEGEEIKRLHGEDRPLMEQQQQNYETGAAGIQYDE